MLNLASHDQREPDLSRNHRVIDKLLDLVVSTEVSTERCAFTPKTLSPEELAQAEEAHFFDLRSDFDETEFEEETE